MVRKYVRKTTKASNYTKDDLTLAENAIRSKILTVKVASLMYNISCPTLYNHISGFCGKNLHHLDALQHWNTQWRKSLLIC